MSHEHSGDNEQDRTSERVVGDPRRPGLTPRSQRGSYLQGDARSTSEPQASPDVSDLRGHEPGDVGNADIAQIVAHVVAQINQHQHIHLPEQAPDPNQLAELREKVPEVYDLWIETTRKRNDHEIWQSRKIIRQPYLLASLGQWLGLTAVLGVLILAGYAFHLDHPWVGAVLGVFDVIGLAAVFNGNQSNRRNPPPPES